MSGKKEFTFLVQMQFLLNIFSQTLVKPADAEPTNPEGRLLISLWKHLFNAIFFHDVQEP